MHNNTVHKPVLFGEVIKYLDPQPGENFIDCTFGGGGHSKEILERIREQGKLLGIDANPEVEKIVCQINEQTNNDKRNKESGGELIFVNDNFRNIKKIYEQFFPYPVNGILCDLGLSSFELEKEDRGFSFLRDAPLDMRFDFKANELTAKEILNKFSIDKLISVFRNFGEIPYPLAAKVSERIVQQRKKKQFATTFDLVDVILNGCSIARSKGGRMRRIHPATLFFQALRIEVNRELDALIEFLPDAIEILKPKGRLAIISFHSLEDRIVKHYFREISKGDDATAKLLTKKPIMADVDEVRDNPRARSAKMRVIEKK
ncbi:16S rRNA (cytosine(1402)-N(4))-methyltransferase [Candidatus Kuenenbacteria bacterium CG08_land_8_20_14_0_20_37_23]|uniref:Ribosomal RNA small subunit methyltransferase H n=1 Tax=Candidatus Kuenenbacteria bacterium CG08_land_8_20_14_0_20_37_23 TaxID=1974617 RepID=A0A2M6XTB5_9BACT|nr:MAG: 16S rRNA (cytosine(1402)-N(4))-methyltransferase [Candidatus Kuenenbacteria bacterium CG08_land_8_20_14_0_20_37_23]